MTKEREKTTASPSVRRLQSTRTFRSRSEREQEVNRLVLVFSAVLGAIILAIVAGALLIDNVLVPSQAVATVNGERITTRDFQRRASFEKWRTGALVRNYYNAFGPQALTDQQYGVTNYYNELTSPTQLGQRVLDQMIEERLIAQYARENNITVTDEEINDEVYQYFGLVVKSPTPTPTEAITATLTPLLSATPTYTPSASPTVTPFPTDIPTSTPTLAPTGTPTALPTGVPTATPGATEQFETFQTDSREYYQNAVEATGFTEAELREVFRAQALRKKVTISVAGEPAKEEEQIKARHILVKTEAEANAVKVALEKGENFAALAAAVSTDPGSKDKGGELGWQGRGVYVKEFEDAAFNATPGQVIGPINTTANGADFGYHIIQIQAKETRPLTPTDSETKQTKKFTDWLTKEVETDASKDPVWYERVPSQPTLRELGIPTQAELGQ